MNRGLSVIASCGNLRAATLLALWAVAVAVLESSLPAAAQTKPPVYPGATLVPGRPGDGPPMCGHKISFISSYKAPKGVSQKALMTWYQQKMPGATSIVDDADATMASGELFTADTEWGVVVQQMLPATSTLAAGERMLGTDVADIGFVHFDPPLGSSLVHLIAAAASNDKTTAAPAKATLGKMCPRPPQ